MKYYLQLAVYWVCILIKYSILVVAKPLALLFSTVDSTVSEWEPSKPLHKSSGDDDIDYDKHLGI